MTRSAAWCAAAWTSLLLAWPAHGETGASRAAGARRIAWDGAALRAAQGESAVRVESVALGPGRRVDLELEPFRVTGSTTRFVLGRKGAADRPLDVPHDRIALLRGHVAGAPGSRVVLALGEKTAAGAIEPGPGERFAVAQGPAGLVVFPEPVAPGGPAAPRPCEAIAVPEAPATTFVSAATTRLARARLIRVAVDTDHEFYQLFGDAASAAGYLVRLYAEIADIYLRDVNARVELAYVRLWDQPDDLFNDVDPSPLSEFRLHWNTTMQHVARDVAQLLSGRRDYPFGGQAYLRAMCNTYGYSVVGYVQGGFPDPSRPSPYHYDIGVVAHELGHNLGAPHTHDPPSVDNCADPASRPQRGTIMSYCSQTWSGQAANEDLYLHRRSREAIWRHLDAASCLVEDCNGNGTADADDVASGTSTDADAGGIPDECEDCDADGVPDAVEIAEASLDADADGVPDECEEDCNANAIPDDHETELGLTPDAYGNGVPDGCETDCDADGVSDYSEIQAEMTLDLDRDARLDACQDCDADGATDLAELAGAHHVWVASGLPGAPIREFVGPAGTLRRISTAAAVDSAQDLLFSPRGTLWVASGGDHRVAEFAIDGQFLGDVVPAGSGGLFAPAGLALHDGRLLVASRATHSVLAYDAATGAPLGALVETGAGGLSEPHGVAIGPDGGLYVASGLGEVLEFDAASGAFVRVLVSQAANGGLSQPRGMAFKPDGNLLVASYGTNAVLEFDGASGAPLGKWAEVGTATQLNQVSPWGVRVGPNGNVFVARTGNAYGSGASDGHDHDHHEADDTVDVRSVAVRASRGELHLTNAQIYEFDARTGLFVRAFVGGNDHGLVFPTGFDFVPGHDRDCNLNQLPDPCDVAVPGADADGDGTLDECAEDCDANGRWDRLDVVPYGPGLDCDANRRPDACDLEDPLRDCDANATLDACEPGAPGVAEARHPPEIAGLVVEALASGAAARLEWLAPGAAFRYDVARGRLSELRGTGTDAAQCSALDVPAPEWLDELSEARPGDGYYYLVRARSRCGVGGWGRDSAGDDRIVSDCPD